MPVYVVVLYSIARPNKQLLHHARGRSVPLLAFRHHQHLLDHLQQHIEQSPTLTHTGEAKLEDEDLHSTLAQPARRSHYTVQ